MINNKPWKKHNLYWFPPNLLMISFTFRFLNHAAGAAVHEPVPRLMAQPGSKQRPLRRYSLKRKKTRYKASQRTYTKTIQNSNFIIKLILGHRTLARGGWTVLGRSAANSNCIRRPFIFFDFKLQWSLNSQLRVRFTWRGPAAPQ